MDKLHWQVNMYPNLYHNSLFVLETFNFISYCIFEKYGRLPSTDLKYWYF